MKLARLNHIGVATPSILPSKGRIYKAHPKHYNDLIM
jgi:hypothetical protein